MKIKYATALSFLLLLGLTFFSFYTHKPQTVRKGEIPETAFSTARALKHLEAITQKPHSVGTQEHERVQKYLLSTLQGMGLQTQIQEGFAYKSGWGALSKAQNIISRIPGTEEGKSLLIMSHYDSAPHTASLGASDAGSGVVTVLEAVRAFLASGKKPKNEIIILFTAAEELGLNGATFFTKNHPWAKNVGLALNFESRGSGGPSNMIVETNGGNGKLIKEFAAANPSHPYANSLTYSIYKILPNDTDSTVLRQYGDIDSFFFAFIGDHFDYHTAMDKYDRLDRTSLEHQGTYLMPLLEYFSNADLNLKSDKDFIYLNMPLIKMVYYPFSWIWPMVILGIILFLGLILFGITKKKLTLRQIGRGFLPFLISLISSTLIAHFGWKLLLVLYPGYQDILHGFTYNGYDYIAAFTALSLAICFFVSHKFYKPIQAASLSLAPLFFWLLISIGAAIYLPGAAFFIIPVYFGILAVFFIIIQKKPNILLLTLLCAPAIFIIAHDIKEFPVGLGLKMLGAGSLFTVLLFGLLLPVIGFYRIRGKLALLFFLVSIGFFVSAHLNAEFTPERPFPTSLNYVYDVDAKKTYWATYNQHPDEWLKSFLGENPENAELYLKNGAGVGKYNTSFTYAAEAPRKPVAPSSIYISHNKVVNGDRELHFSIYPQREINDMILTAPIGIPFKYVEFNGQVVEKEEDEPYIFSNRKTNTLISYRVADRDPLEVKIVVPVTADLKFTLLDFSYDLLENRDFNVPSRPENTMPMPFIYTDAIITKQDLNMGVKEEMAQKNTADE